MAAQLEANAEPAVEETEEGQITGESSTTTQSVR